MTSPYIPNDVVNQRPSNTRRKRFLLVIVLSTILVLLGTITLSTEEILGKSLVSANKKNIDYRYAAVSTSIPLRTSKPKQTPSPSVRTTHTPTLGYPISNGNTHIPEIALTFDDGPNPFYTPQVLAILRKYEIKATFFDVGYLIVDYPNIVRQEYNEGHLVANHSWSHPDMTLLSGQSIESQLTSTILAIQHTIGIHPTFFRPPYGAFNNIILAKAKKLGLTTILWNGSSEDWNLPGVNIIVTKILSYARNGAILLLHDGGGNRAQTVAALPRIISNLQSRGFKFVTIQQLVDDLITP